jgi:hypothetical protein
MLGIKMLAQNLASNSITVSDDDVDDFESTRA